MNQKIYSAKIDFKTAVGQIFPKTKVSVGLGPHPEYRYTPIQPIFDKNGNVEKDKYGIVKYTNPKWEKDYSWGKWGIALEFDSSFVLPIFTFGKLYYGRSAAKTQISLKKSEKQIALLKMRKEASLFYDSYILALNIKDVMDDVVSKIKEAESKIKKWLYEEKEGITQKDLIKLRIEKEKILYKYAKLNWQIKTLTYVFNEIEGEDWKIEDTTLKKQKIHYSLLELKNNLLNGVYAQYMKSGISAYLELYKLKRSELFPDIGLGGSFSVSYTNNVYADGYPTPGNPYNGVDGKIGIGIVFDMNFLNNYYSMKKAYSKYKTIKFTAEIEKKKKLIELQKQYNELQYLDEKIKHLKKAYKYSKGLMTMEMGNSASGFTNTKDLIDSIKDYIEMELEMFNYYF